MDEPMTGSKAVERIPTDEGRRALPSRDGLEARRIGRLKQGGDGWLFREIDLALWPGDRLALLGSSGAGKSLLLRALAQLDPIDEGTVLWNGRAVGHTEIPRFRSEVIYLHQRPALTLTDVESQLRLPFTLKAHVHRRFDRDRVVGILSELGRDASFLAKPVDTLSGGEAQLTALLRALQLDPTVFLLDEPTASLDPTTSSAIERLVGLWYGEDSQRRSFIWVTHDLDQARRVSSAALHIDAGRLVARA